MTMRMPALLVLLCALALGACAPGAVRPHQASPYDRRDVSADSARRMDKEDGEEKRRRLAADIADTSEAALDAWRRASPDHEAVAQRALAAHDHRKSLAGKIEFAGLAAAIAGAAVFMTGFSKLDFQGCDGSDPDCHAKEKAASNQASLGSIMVAGGLLTLVTGAVIGAQAETSETALRNAVRAPHDEARRIPRSKDEAPLPKKSSAPGDRVPSSDPFPRRR